MSAPASRREAGRFQILPTVLCTLAIALPPTPAEAHLVTTGLGPIYDGILHLLAGADDLLAVLSMAMLAGQNGPTAGRRTLFALTGAWLAGGIAGFLVGHSILPGMATTASFVALGLFIAADRRMSPATVVALAMAVGILHGWLNGAGIGEAQREVLALAGIVSAIFVLVAIIAAFVVSLRLPWARVAVRVAGSWVAATGLFMLGWAFRAS